MENKKCNGCLESKDISAFYKVDSKCKKCRKSLVMEYRRKNLEKIRDYDRKRGKLEHRKKLCVENTKKRRKDQDGYLHAHNAVAKALVKGILIRSPCAMCGSGDLVHAHHDDYSKPLDVIWLCVIHHKSRHAYLDYLKQDTF